MDTDMARKLAIVLGEFRKPGATLTGDLRELLREMDRALLDHNVNVPSSVSNARPPKQPLPEDLLEEPTRLGIWGEFVDFVKNENIQEAEQ